MLDKCVFAVPSISDCVAASIKGIRLLHRQPQRPQRPQRLRRQLKLLQRQHQALVLYRKPEPLLIKDATQKVQTAARYPTSRQH